MLIVGISAKVVNSFKIAIAALNVVKVASNTIWEWGKTVFSKYTIAQKATALWTKIVTASQWALNVAMSANPIGLVIAGVLVLGAAIAAVVVYWDSMTEAIANVWTWLTKFVSAMASLDMGKILSLLGIGSSAAPAGEATLFGKAVPTISSQSKNSSQNTSSTQRSEVTVKFDNLPRGSRVNPGRPASGLGIESGYAMAN